MPVLLENGHPALAQKAYRKNDTIFVSMEAIRSICDGNSACLSLYDLEKAFDSTEHPILLRSLFQAGVNGKSWRLVRSWYNNLSVVVRTGSTSIPVLRGVQQGSVLPPSFFSHHG